MTGVLSSPRRRRRLAWLSGVALVAAGLVVVGLKFTNTAPKEEQVTDQPGVAAPVLPKSVKFRRETRQQALNVAADFVSTAVVRKKLAHAWEITG